MADRIAPAMRAMQVCSPLPDDVMPNIMLRVEHRQDFARLACTCRGFYAWSEPWLKSRRQAAKLNDDPQRLIKLPAWIKTHSRHLHPGDWNALQRWTVGDERGNDYGGVAQRRIAFFDAIELKLNPAPSATEQNAAHLDFVLFSPRLKPDVNEEAASEADKRLAANAYFALAGFEPSGEAWQYDVLEGATAWLKENTEKISPDALYNLHRWLVDAMASVMTAQRSPKLAMDLLTRGLLKTHDVIDVGTRGAVTRRWEAALLTALVKAVIDSELEAGSSEASAFLYAIHLVVSELAKTKENAAVALHAVGLRCVMALMTEKTWTPGSAGTAYLKSLVQAVRDRPGALGHIGNTLISKKFITSEDWDKLLLTLQDASI